MKTLKQLTQNFDYINSDITEENFPLPVKQDEVEYELVHFDRHIASEDAIRGLSTPDGWRPANIYELLEWKDWNEKDYVAALGSVAKVDGTRRVPCLNNVVSERRLILSWFGGDWSDGCHFLRVRTLSSDTLKTENSDSLTIEKPNIDEIIDRYVDILKIRTYPYEELKTLLKDFYTEITNPSTVMSKEEAEKELSIIKNTKVVIK